MTADTLPTCDACGEPTRFRTRGMCNPCYCRVKKQWVNHLIPSLPPTEQERQIVTRRDGLVEIPLTRGKVALIDEADAERVLRHKWTALPKSDGKWYARRAVMGKDKVHRTIYLHRFILDAPKGIHVDHWNGDGLDNRRSNLRLATRTQNAFNRGARNVIGLKGVSRNGSGYRAAITAYRITHHLGTYGTAEEAARAYDAKAVELHGEFARLNFPSEGATLPPADAGTYAVKGTVNASGSIR